MLVSIQFPLADIRPFLGGTRLGRPNWLVPETDRDFVRYFGHIRDRKRGGIEGWIGEGTVCEARHALKLDPATPIRPALDTYRLRCAYRRFFSDGLSTAKLEVGFAPKTGRIPSTIDVNVVCRDLERLRARVRDVSNASLPQTKHVPLLSAGSHLATLYLVASTSKADRATIQPGWVAHGKPTILIEYNSAREVVVSTAFSDHKLQNIPDLTMASKRVKFGPNSTVRVVLLGYKSPDGACLARQLRIQLMRLHAEHECLACVLRALLTPGITFVPGTAQSNALETFVTRSTQQILKLQRGAHKGFNLISQTAYDSIETINPGLRASLESAVKQLNIDKNVNYKMNQYIQLMAKRGTPVNFFNGGQTVNTANVTNSGHGPIIIQQAEHMKDVAATVNQNLGQSSATDDIKLLVQQLTDQIKELANNPVDPAHLQNMGNDLTTLSTEMASAQPRRKWYEVSLNGIKEAATAIGASAHPIIETVKMLLPLLAP